MARASRNDEHAPALRGAIIGFGNVAARAHLPAWVKSRRARIEAVLEPEPGRAKLAEELLPDARIYSQLVPMLDSHELDFVDICTPPSRHADYLNAALRAGLHVLCEKPLVTSLDDLAAIKESVGRSAQVVFTVNNWKYAPLWEKAVQLVREQTIGAVRSASLTVLRPPQAGGGVSPWRKNPAAGGGILLDHGWHQFYLLLSLLGEFPLAIRAYLEYAESEERTPLEETADVLLSFSSADARMHLTWRAERRRNEGLIGGEEGMIALQDDHLIVQPRGKPAKRYDFDEALSAGSQHEEWMQPVIEEFLGELHDGTRRGANLEEASWCVNLIHLARRSQREGSRLIPVAAPQAGTLLSYPQGHDGE